MRKINLFILFLGAFFFSVFLLSSGRANEMGGNSDDSMSINDEGYGNEDAEYYNSEDDVVNVEDPGTLQENSSINAS